MTFERLATAKNHSMRSLPRSSLTLLVLTLFSCDGASAARGTVLVRTSGGVEAREGIAADRTIDGFAIAFDHAVLALDDFTVRTQLGDDARVMADPAIVELVPTSAETWRFDGVPAQRWDDVGYVTAPARADARRLGVDDAIADAMITNGWSSYYEGTTSSARCTPSSGRASRCCSSEVWPSVVWLPAPAPPTSSSYRAIERRAIQHRAIEHRAMSPSHRSRSAPMLAP